MDILLNMFAGCMDLPESDQKISVSVLCGQADLHWDGHHPSEVSGIGLQVSLQWSDSGSDQTGKLTDWQTSSSVPTLLQQEELT